VFQALAARRGVGIAAALCGRVTTRENGVPMKANRQSGLSDDELEKARAELTVSCAPQEFWNKVDAVAGKFTLEERFTSPRLGFLRDAATIAEFAIKLPNATSARLASKRQTYPDGFVDADGKTLWIEATEVDIEGRRRGDEYRAGVAVTDKQKTVKSAAAELDRGIIEKIKKNYNPKPTLVIYLNLDQEGADESEMIKIFDDAKQKHGPSFEGIKILWKGKLY